MTQASADEGESELRSALKHSAVALKAEGVPFALGGGYALWVCGAPEPVHGTYAGIGSGRSAHAATCARWPKPMRA